MGASGARSGVLWLCMGCKGRTHSNWCFLFKSFISEPEAGTRHTAVRGSDGAKAGGGANNGAVCDAECPGEAGESGTIG